MNSLVLSFQQHLGLRGVHIYSDDSNCRFLAWDEVIAFINSLPGEPGSEFSEKLMETLANYNPDKEFLAVRRNEDAVSIELYSKAI